MNSSTGITHQTPPPISLYLKVWLALFILSTFSYMVDYLQLQGMLRWGLIISFMLLKASLIVSIFMHVFWERWALIGSLIAVPTLLISLIILMAIEADFIHLNRLLFFAH
ncbi:MAG: cytochrome C oxidase subunit IV family protein [Pseudomonadales bacterium]|nr:cytochrome C oxidase subunit IV family protein [Pseudomonadales bacterium]